MTLRAAQSSDESWTMRHVLFPAMRQHLRLPTRLAIDGKALLRGVPFSLNPTVCSQCTGLKVLKLS